MDRIEAIEYVKQAFAVWQSEFCTPDGDWSEETKALDLAIEALVLQDKYIKAVERMIEGAKEINKFLEEATAPKEMTLEEWQELDKAIQGDAENATTTDCISRADTIKAMCAECEWKCTVASCYRYGCKCKGYDVERMGAKMKGGTENE